MTTTKPSPPSTNPAPALHLVPPLDRERLMQIQDSQLADYNIDVTRWPGVDPLEPLGLHQSRRLRDDTPFHDLRTATYWLGSVDADRRARLIAERNEGFSQTDGRTMMNPLRTEKIWDYWVNKECHRILAVWRQDGHVYRVADESRRYRRKWRIAFNITLVSVLIYYGIATLTWLTR